MTPLDAHNVTAMVGVGQIIAALASIWGQPPHAGSTIRSDERIVLFPALAEPQEAGGWRVVIHGWIFEPENDSGWRERVIEALGAEAPCEDEASRAIFRDRARAFIVDNERDKSVALRIGQVRVVSEPSGPNGHFRAEAQVPEAMLRPGARGKLPEPWTVQVDLPGGDPRRFIAQVQPVPAEGVSVICDIDDTVRVTHVGDRKALLASTFCKAYEPIPEVRSVLARYRDEGAAFHYVSASPWQLYEPLSDFLGREGFPAGSFHLKSLRLKDETVLDLFKDARSQKVPLIEDLMRRWPRRKFVLVGDNGEADPELYGDLARRLPDRVEHVYIRDTKGLGREDPRYAAAFKDVPPERWTLLAPAAKEK